MYLFITPVKNYIMLKKNGPTLKYPIANLSTISKSETKNSTTEENAN